MDAFKVVRDFEQALCDYTGAKYAVTVNSCTMALLLACKWSLRGKVGMEPFDVSIPKRTYVGVPMSIIHAGARPVFRDEKWLGYYHLDPLPGSDSARWFTGGMFDGHNAKTVGAPLPFSHMKLIKGERHPMACVSFHWSKTLGIQQGGAILHDDPEADQWLRRARFDGRKEGVPPKDDHDLMVGWHCYMSPEVAAEGLVRLSHLPWHNDPLPNSDYPDLPTLECFK